MAEIISLTEGMMSLLKEIEGKERKMFEPKQFITKVPEWRGWCGWCMELGRKRTPAASTVFLTLPLQGFLLFACLFETGSLYVVLAVLKLFVPHASLELADIWLPLPPKYWD